MSVKDQIEAGFKKALIGKNELELSVFRLLKSSIKNMEIAKGHELTDEEAVAVLESGAKQRRDSIDQYTQAHRQDLADREKAELAIIESFLPAKMNEEEVKTVVKAKLAELKTDDFGRVMGAVMAELKGKADGSLVQRVVKEELGQ